MKPSDRYRQLIVLEELARQLVVFSETRGFLGEVPVLDAHRHAWEAFDAWERRWRVGSAWRTYRAASQARGCHEQTALIAHLGRPTPPDPVGPRLQRAEARARDRFEALYARASLAALQPSGSVAVRRIFADARLTAPKPLVLELAARLADRYLTWVAGPDHEIRNWFGRGGWREFAIEDGPPVGQAIEHAFWALGEPVVEHLTLGTATAILKSLTAVADRRGLDRTALRALARTLARFKHGHRRGRGRPWTSGYLPLPSKRDRKRDGTPRQRLEEWTRWFCAVELKIAYGLGAPGTSVVSDIARELPAHARHRRGETYYRPIARCGCRKTVRDALKTVRDLLGVARRT